VDFSLSEAQMELAGLARKILAGSDEPWRDLAGAGVLAAGLPEDLGGAGLGFLEQCSVLAEAGRAVSPVPYLASAVLAAGAIATFGSAHQQQRWAVPAGDGSAVLTVALAEEDGNDPASPATRAGQAGGHWLLSGVKTAVPALPSADVVLVPASRADEAGEVMVFLVEPSDAGVTLEPQALTDGAPAGRLVLDGVEVGADRVLGGPGQGADVARWLAARATVGLCAVQAGVLQRALELTAEYARTREQFGRPIGSFQAVAQRLADGYIDVEAAWLTMWQAAYLLSAGPVDGDEAAAAVSTAKFWAADAGHRVAHTAVHVHGGTGIDLSHPIHKYFTAAKHAEFTLGGATQQLVTLGDLLA
jgi:alkylation response protein AidB-like acyl-CoA dehydrogenase